MLSIAYLIVEVVQRKAQAVEVIALEMRLMKELKKEGSCHMKMMYTCYVSRDIAVAEETTRLQIAGIRILSITPATRLAI